MHCFHRNLIYTILRGNTSLLTYPISLYLKAIRSQICPEVGFLELGEYRHRVLTLYPNFRQIGNISEA